jgi:hypothetical protein
MSDQGVEAIYICANCMLPGEDAGPCPRCGRARIGCRPGDPDDPCRRPWIDGQGRVRTRAPLWWLRKTVTSLAEAVGRSG